MIVLSIDRTKVIRQTLSNFIEAGIITPTEVEHTYSNLAVLSTPDLLIALIESHNRRNDALEYKMSLLEN